MFCADVIFRHERGQTTSGCDKGRVNLESDLPTMRKTSYAVTFLLVSVSLTLVSPLFPLRDPTDHNYPLSQNILAITRTDW
jgi:hypothetical protein